MPEGHPHKCGVFPVGDFVILQKDPVCCVLAHGGYRFPVSHDPTLSWIIFEKRSRNGLQKGLVELRKRRNHRRGRRSVIKPTLQKVSNVILQPMPDEGVRTRGGLLVKCLTELVRVLCGQPHGHIGAGRCVFGTGGRIWIAHERAPTCEGWGKAACVVRDRQWRRRALSGKPPACLERTMVVLGWVSPGARAPK